MNGHRLVGAALFAFFVVAACKVVEAKHVGACTTTFGELPAGNQPGDPVKCTCSASAGSTGAVWGTDTYTADSSICRAAIHAGVIGASGGDVTVRKMAGCDSHQPSTQNGVTTSSWGPYPSSYYFTTKGVPQCFGSKTVASSSAPMRPLSSASGAPPMMKK